MDDIMADATIRELLTIGGVFSTTATEDALLDSQTNTDATSSSSSSYNDIDPLTRLEMWLDVGDVPYYSPITSTPFETMEDSAPFSSSFYRCLGQMLVEVWNPSLTRANKNSNDNKDGGPTNNSNNNTTILLKDFLQILPDHQHNKTNYNVSLFQSCRVVRMTRLLHHWMDLNVMGESTNTNTIQCLSQLLLYHCEGNITTDNNNNNNNGSTSNDGTYTTNNDNNTTPLQHSTNHMPRIPILSALFHHISKLPQLQYEILRYTQSNLPNNNINNTTTTSSGGTTTTTTTTSSPIVVSERLELWQASQQESERLGKELDQHIQHLQDILMEWYSMSHVKLRSTYRLHLGHVWSKFLWSSIQPAQNIGMGRYENTSACGISMTLQVLYRILQGMKQQPEQSQQSQGEVLLPLQHSYEHLLMELLLPLHKPSSMVLWRDQTPLLSLYHEPLVQCMAIIIQKKPNTLIPAVLSKLLLPEIWPSMQGGGSASANTPKIVLLLHEVDTFFGLLKSTSTTTAMDLEDEQEDTNNNTGPKSSATSKRSPLSFMKDVIRPLTVRLGACISSDNSRVAERSLQFFQNDIFTSLIQAHLSSTLPILLQALCRVSDQMRIPWNPTVRKMTLLVMNELEAYDADLFAQTCRTLFGSSSGGDDDSDGGITNGNGESTNKNFNEPQQPQQPNSHGVMSTTTVASSSSSSLPNNNGSSSSPMSFPGGTAMPSSTSRSMLPPPSRPPKVKKGEKPPLTITGVAPWAMSSPSTTTSSLPRARVRPRIPGKKSLPPPSIGGSRLPPINDASSSLPPISTSSNTVLGGHHQRPIPSPIGASLPHKKRAGQGNLPLSLSPIPSGGISETAKPISTTPDQPSPSSNPGLEKVRLYMDQLKPSSSGDGTEEDDDADGMSSWSKAQMAESPTLLPDLKFHDLVFGQELGSGAFGTVKYARRIDKHKTRSYWAEYAVKIVSTTKIEELGYEQSINREIATLRILSHPGIARLISSFRFRDGAYLVLEYASKGDLHTVLRNSGSLDHESTKFVIGEIVAALCSIHDLEFVYGDLKPENILITETGHVKLTDFGACRPFTDNAKKLISSNGRSVIRQLRDGDWKSSTTASSRQTNNDDLSVGDSMSISSADNYLEEVEDDRVEGTTAYLPPEVVIGAIPTIGADSWALGCVLFQCIAGRPPILEDDDTMTRNKIVAFSTNSSADGNPHHEIPNNTHDIFSQPAGCGDSGADSTTFRPETKALILRLLQHEPTHRPNMRQVAEDSFFHGTDPFNLYKQQAPPLDVGSVAPVSDAKWSRRQFSSIWAPQPQAYAIASTSNNKKNATSFGSSRAAPIPEGDEASAPFSKSFHQQSGFFEIPENMALN